MDVHKIADVPVVLRRQMPAIQRPQFLLTLFDVKPRSLVSACLITVRTVSPEIIGAAVAATVQLLAAVDIVMTEQTPL